MVQALIRLSLMAGLLSSCNPGALKPESKRRASGLQTANSSALSNGLNVDQIGVKAIGPQETVLEASGTTCPKRGSNPGSTEEQLWVPDGPARAYIDKSGKTRLLIPHHLSYAMVGSSLNDVKLDCSAPVHTSTYNQDPNAHNDASWPWSTYRMDNGEVYVLYHNEFHAPQHPDTNGGCKDVWSCWYPSILWGIARDSVNFKVGESNHVIAKSVKPFSANVNPANSLSDPSSIMKHPRNGKYYALALRHGEPLSVCLMRADNLTDPNSWKLWNGSSFSQHPRDGGSCPSVIGENAQLAPGSLHYSKYLDAFVHVGFGYRKPDGAQGLFMQVALNEELTAWSSPKIVLEAPNPWGTNGTFQGRMHVYYPSFIDPSGGSNFDVLGDKPYLYFMENTGGGVDPVRRVRRIPVQFKKEGGEVPNRPMMLYRIGGGAHFSNGAGSYCSIVGMDMLSSMGFKWDFNNLPEYSGHGANVAQNDPTIGVRCASGGGSGSSIGVGCYRIDGTGFYSNGQGASCPFLQNQMQGICGTSDFNSLGVRAEHGGNRVDPACGTAAPPSSQQPPSAPQISAGCYRIDGTGFYSNGQGASCPFLQNQMQGLCGTSDFNSLGVRAEHGGNRVDPGCGSAPPPPPPQVPANPSPSAQAEVLNFPRVAIFQGSNGRGWLATRNGSDLSGFSNIGQVVTGFDCQGIRGDEASKGVRTIFRSSFNNNGWVWDLAGWSEYYTRVNQEKWNGDDVAFCLALNPYQGLVGVKKYYSPITAGRLLVLEGSEPPNDGLQWTFMSVIGYGARP